MRVAIVGAGLMGTATAWPLTDNGHDVRLVGTHLDREIIASCLETRFHPRLRRILPPGVQPFYVEQIAKALEGVELVVSGVNSYGVHWIGRTLGPHLRPGTTIIAVTKGLEATESGDLRLLPDVLADELPADTQESVTLAAIGGPCIAGELAGRRPSCVIFAGRNPAALARLATIFGTGYYHIWTSTDLVGVEVCAALKNAFTLGVGLAGGLLERAGRPDEAEAHMHNLAAALFAQATTEIVRMVRLLGGQPWLAWGLAGVGDMYVTCIGGRTVKLGRLIGSGLSYPEARQVMAGETLESAAIIREVGEALPKLEARGLVAPEEFPLLRGLYDILYRETPVEIPFAAFFPGLQRHWQ
jgi:glycerol-3-phosphate dehydrogenase (NAD(P)+)